MRCDRTIPIHLLVHLKNNNIAQVNPYYASVYDDVNNVNGEAIAAAAQTLARALAAVATDDDNTARSLMVWWWWFWWCF